MGWFIYNKYIWIPFLWIPLLGIAMMTTLLIFIFKGFYNAKIYKIYCGFWWNAILFQSLLNIGYGIVYINDCLEIVFTTVVIAALELYASLTPAVYLNRFKTGTANLFDFQLFVSALLFYFLFVMALMNDKLNEIFFIIRWFISIFR